MTIDEAFARRVLPRRSAGAHKWEVGGVLIIGGAPSYYGAPTLSALGAMRAGAGIVTLAISRPVVPVAATIVPEATFIPLPDGDAQPAAIRAATLIGEKIDRYRAIVVGPGISDDQFADRLLARLFGLQHFAGARGFGFGGAISSGNQSNGDASRLLPNGTPIVVDADALTWLSQQQDWWESATPHSMVLTPHVGELSRLLSMPTSDVANDPRAAVREAVDRWQQTVVLKHGAVTASNGQVTIEFEDSPLSLATAGTGDILAGIMGGLLAQGLDQMDAIGLALFAGARAAREVERETGTLGLLASDLPKAIAAVLRDLE
jgi:ADP-dependent NAD(P)H-hydrate dehydratase / NAD(P)H-hydrate epimerase